MALVAVLRLADGEARAWVGDPDVPGSFLADESRPVVPAGQPSGRSAVGAWETACREALAAAVETAGRSGFDYLGLTVSAAPSSLILLDRVGKSLAVVPVTGCGAAALESARAADLHRWHAVTQVALPADWLLRRLTGTAVAELSGACAVGLADATTQDWTGGLQDPGASPRRWAPLFEAGAHVGGLVEGWPLPATLPVVVGRTPVQLAAMGAGGAVDAALVVVVTGDRAVVVSTDPTAAACWPESREIGLLSGGLTNLVVELRAAEARVSAVVVCGDGGADRSGLAAELARALGREVRSTGHAPVEAAAGIVLVARAVGAHAHLPGLPPLVHSP